VTMKTIFPNVFGNVLEWVCLFLIFIITRGVSAFRAKYCFIVNKYEFSG